MTIALNAEIAGLYRRFSEAGIGHIVGEYAAGCLRAAKTLYQFRVLEAAGKVRLRAEPEQEDYFDVFGKLDTDKERKAIEAEIDRKGCWWVVAETACPCCGKWSTADSIGMCIYHAPCSPFENDYVIALMAAAIEATKKGH